MPSGTAVDPRGRLVGGLGEFECSGRLVYANLVPRPLVVAVEPVAGVLAGVVDVLPAVPAAEGPFSVFAYDAAREVWLCRGSAGRCSSRPSSRRWGSVADSDDAAAGLVRGRGWGFS